MIACSHTYHFTSPDAIGRIYPNIRGAYPYTEILPPAAPAITCKQCPDTVTMASCRDDLQNNWQVCACDGGTERNGQKCVRARDAHALYVMV